MIYYVDGSRMRSGCGTKEHPFQTISEAAQIACAGDEVVVAPGVYREYVDPRHGGCDVKKRIIYRSMEPLGAVISGAEVVKGWKHHQGNVWKTMVPNEFFGSYNPYTTLVEGDWYFALHPVHTGEVYLNGKSMYEVHKLEDVLEPMVYKSSWEPEATIYTWYTEQTEDGENTVLYANFQGADPNEETVEINVRRNCFYPSQTGVNYITLSGFKILQAATNWAPPTAYQEGMVGPHWSKGWIIEDCEISDSRCVGISLGKYLQPENDNRWSRIYLKDGTQTERDCIFQALREGWAKENIGSHIIRRCHIHDCGQAGIVGHLGGVFSVIEDNHIHHINTKQDLAGAEIGGIKMHAAIDVIYRRNHIHHCTRGIWLDWQAQGTRVTQNLFHDNVPPKGTEIADSISLGEDVFVEVSHGPTLIDHNLLLSPCSCRISAQGIALVHNLIGGSFTWVGSGVDNDTATLPSPRYTPYHVPHSTDVAGVMTILHGDIRCYNNIFVQQEIRADLESFAEKENAAGMKQYNFACGTLPYNDYPTLEEYMSQFTEELVQKGSEEVPAEIRQAKRDLYYSHLPVHTGGNVYFNAARPCNSEKAAYQDTSHEIELSLSDEDGKTFLHTNLYQYLPTIETQCIHTALLGQAFEPEQGFENPDGTEILFDKDYYGKKHTLYPIPGPFARGREEYMVGM